MGPKSHLSCDLYEICVWDHNQISQQWDPDEDASFYVFYVNHKYTGLE